MENLLKTTLSYLLRLIDKISPKFAAELAWSFFCKPRIRKKPLDEFETKLVKQAELFFIDSDEYKIAIYRWSGNNNKTILLTHGWGGHALNFAHLILHLITNGFDVVAHDSPAHGNSSGKQTNLLYNTNALLNVLEKTGPIHVFIGHSFGNIANTYAYDLLHQFKQALNIEKIVLIAGPNKLADIFASFIQTMQLSNKTLEIFHQKLKKLIHRDIHTMSTIQFLQNFNGQCLIIHDEKDQIVPYTDAVAVANGIHAELFTTRNVGHSRILSSTTVLNKVTNFLTENSS